MSETNSVDLDIARLNAAVAVVGLGIDAAKNQVTVEGDIKTMLHDATELLQRAFSGPLLDARGAAALLSMIPSRVVRLANKGKLPTVRLPGDSEPKFIPSEIHGWIHKHRRDAAAVVEGQSAEGAVK